MKSSLSMAPKRLVAALMVAAGIGASVPAHAETFALGLISSSQSVDLFNDGLSGWFYDSYTFTVAEGSYLNLSAAVSNVFGREVTGASNLWSDLYVGSGQFVRFAVGSTQALADGTFEKTATFNGLRLGAGSYGLFVQGLVQPGAGSSATTGTYNGQLRFDVPSPVPEPGAFLLMAAGLAGVGVAAARRRRLG